MQQKQQPSVSNQQSQSEPFGQVTDQAKQQVSQFADTARERGFSWLADQKTQASGTLENAAHAFTELGHRLEEQGQAPIGQSLSMAGERIEQFSRALKEREVDELYSDIENFARQQPAYILGGAAVLGFL